MMDQLSRVSAAGMDPHLGLSIGSYRAADLDPVRLLPYSGHDREKTGTHRIELYAGAALIDITRYHVKYNDTRDHGLRQPVKRFSKESRSRLFKRVSKFRQDDLVKGLFVTLTYHNTIKTGQECKPDLRAFNKRLQRKYPRACIIWKMEYQERGAVHFHLLVLGVPFLAPGWVAQAWNEIAEPGDREHLQAGTEVRRVHSYKHVVNYTGKYLSKETETQVNSDNPGRFWGIVGASQLYQVAPIRVEITWRQATQLYRFMDHLRKSKSKKGYKTRRYKPSVSHFWYGSPGLIMDRLPEICNP